MLTIAASDPRAPRRKSFLGSLARPLAFRILGRLKNGQLLIQDPVGRRVVGRPTSATSDEPPFVEVADLGVYPRLLFGGSIGAAETYAKRRWSSSDLTSVIRVLARDQQVKESLDGLLTRAAAAVHRRYHRRMTNTRRQSRHNIEAHYDLGNDFFGAFLDQTMTYSCAIFPTPNATLEEASIHKLDHICRKLDLQPTDELLEIGTGWGSLCLHAAAHYGCRVVTTTISTEQHRCATARVRDAGLADRVSLLTHDYRDLPGLLSRQFDKVVSVEMIEAVGQEFLPVFLDLYDRMLRPGGTALIQAIVIADELYDGYARGVDFIQRYIFPGGFLPSVAALRGILTQRTSLEVSNVEDIAAHYPPTLRHWRRSLLARWDQLVVLGYPDELLRLWDFYFCYSEAGFLEGSVGDVQLLLRKRPPNLSADRQ
ncbi:MAG: cyclopropane-fatty-acyl-phospholipid synthase family protein [Acidobacteriota bacterium]|nr:cyclopropane-fatty-acyl-phospholipid synthase family protein [Acidobacteriota bacterium]